MSRNLDRPCNEPTPIGPCDLREGHPVGPMYPGHNGHMPAGYADPEAMRAGDLAALRGGYRPPRAKSGPQGATVLHPLRVALPLP
jgi:hypothetical protein